MHSWKSKEMTFHCKKEKKTVSYATEEANMKFLYSRRIMEDRADSWVLLKEDFKQKYLNSWD